MIKKKKKNTNQKPLGEEGVYLADMSWSQSISERSEGRNLEVEIETEAIEECYSLAFSSWLGSTSFLYTTQDHLSRGGAAHCGLDPPRSVVIPKNALNEPAYK